MVHAIIDPAEPPADPPTPPAAPPTPAAPPFPAAPPGPVAPSIPDPSILGLAVELSGESPGRVGQPVTKIGKTTSTPTAEKGRMARIRRQLTQVASNQPPPGYFPDRALNGSTQTIIHLG